MQNINSGHKIAIFSYIFRSVQHAMHKLHRCVPLHNVLVQFDLQTAELWTHHQFCSPVIQRE